MASLVVQSQVLAADITIQIGNHVWEINTSFLIYLLIAAIVGVIAELIVGWRLPFGIIGAIIAGIIGVWIMTQVIIITGIPDLVVNGVPVVRGVIGALILIAIWHLLTYPFWHRRRPYYRYSR